MTHKVKFCRDGHEKIFSDSNTKLLCFQLMDLYKFYMYVFGKVISVGISIYLMKILWIYAFSRQKSKFLCVFLS